MSSEQPSQENQGSLARCLALLLQTFPEAFTTNQLDFQALSAALGQASGYKSKSHTFTWPDKDAVIHQILAPAQSSLTACLEESLDFDQTGNIFVEGENLEALKLLVEEYQGRISTIYIDPPYNTGNDFIFNDRFHSAWLSMMSARLHLAHQLLSSEGLIFISIDDHEVHHLRMLMDEIFGETCFKNCIVLRRGIKSVQAQFETVGSLTVGHEYILLYARSATTRLKKYTVALDEPESGSWNNHWRGTDRPTMRYELFGIMPESGQWRWRKERSLKAIANYKRMLEEMNAAPGEVEQQQIDDWYWHECNSVGRKIDLLRLSVTGKPEHYVPPKDSKLGSDLWTDLTPRGSADLEALFGCKVFDNPKPVWLVKRILELATQPDREDLVLDFFAGSCTTAHAVLELNNEDGGNRRFICVQAPEPLDRTHPAGKNAAQLGLETIADIGKERMRRVIGRLKAGCPPRSGDTDLGFRVYKLT